MKHLNLVALLLIIVSKMNSNPSRTRKIVFAPTKVFTFLILFISLPAFAQVSDKPFKAVCSGIEIERIDGCGFDSTRGKMKVLNGSWLSWQHEIEYNPSTKKVIIGTRSKLLPGNPVDKYDAQILADTPDRLDVAVVIRSSGQLWITSYYPKTKMVAISSHQGASIARHQTFAGKCVVTDL